MSNTQLSLIGDKYKTTKNTHVSFGKTILDIYEEYFEKKRFLPLNILEIGVLNGASLFVWNEYFPLANIFGIDINQPRIKKENIIVYKGDQGNVDDLETIYCDIRNKIGLNEKLDIIIDDGSHINKYTLDTFNFFWPKLNSDGLYIIEDTLCTYDKASMDWPGMHFNVAELDLNNKREDFNTFIQDHLRYMDHDLSYMYFMHFYRNLIIMKKA